MSTALDVDTREVEAFMKKIMAVVPRARYDAMGAIMLKAEAQVKELYVPVGVTENLSGSVTGTVEDGGQTGELRTNNIEYAAAQEFNHEYDHSREPGPTGERGADYIGRGIRYAAEIAPEIMRDAIDEGLVK
ncbi:MAG: hypothetical protein ACYDCO_28055 [Armatimonadota bacterium]